ncbi:MAG: CopG family transcriptional regulator [Chloroflexota bacterium]|nr:MAG: CopG family transcriptional regulator [Chloroflexota bacterium]
MTSYVRKQFQIAPETDAALARVAAKRHVSEAQIVREALTTYLARNGETREERVRRAMSIVGIFSGDGSNVSENHDDYLAEIDWQSS